MNFSTAAYISNATVIIFIVPLAAAGILLVALLDTLVAALPVVRRYVVLRPAFGFSV